MSDFSDLGQRMFEDLQCDPQCNVLFSPAAVAYILLALALGSGQKTRNEVNRILPFHYFDTEIEQHLEELGSSMNVTNYGKNSFNLKSLFVMTKGISLKAEFREKLQNLGIEIKTVNIKDAKGPNETNSDFLKLDTNEPHIELPRREDESLMIVQSVNFKMDWKYPFKLCQEQVFMSSEQQKLRPVLYLRQKLNFWTFRLSNLYSSVEVVQIPMDHHSFNVFLFLPNRMTVKEVVLEADPFDLANYILSHPTELEVEVIVPQFKMSLLTDLTSSIYNLLFESPFKGGDFAPMTDSLNVKLTDIIQSLGLTVSTDGVGGTVNAGTSMMRSLRQPEVLPPQTTYKRMFINRPFLLMITYSDKLRVPVLMAEVDDI